MSFKKVHITSSCENNILDLQDVENNSSIVCENNSNVFVQKVIMSSENVSSSGIPVSIYSTSIQDTATSSYKLWSSMKVDNEINNLKNWATTEINSVTNSVADNTIFVKNDKPTAPGEPPFDRIIGTRMPHDVILNLDDPALEVEFTLVNGVSTNISTTNASENVDLRDILNESGYIEIDDGANKYRGQCVNIEERKFDFFNLTQDPNWNSVTNAKIYVVKYSIEFIFGDESKARNDYYWKTIISHRNFKTYIEATAPIGEEQILWFSGLEGSSLDSMKFVTNEASFTGELSVANTFTANSTSSFVGRANFIDISISGEVKSSLDLDNNNLNNVNNISGTNLSLNSNLNANQNVIYNKLVPFKQTTRTFNLTDDKLEYSEWLSNTSPIGSQEYINVIDKIDSDSNLPLLLNDEPTIANLKLNIEDQGPTDNFGYKCLNFGSETNKKGLYKIDISFVDRTSYDYGFTFQIIEFDYDEGPMGASKKILNSTKFNPRNQTIHSDKEDIERRLNTVYNYVPETNKRIAILVFSQNAACKLYIKQVSLSVHMI